MATVKIRHGYTIDDNGLHYNEEPSTYEYASKLAGRKLDKRKCYAVIDGQVCEWAKWTTNCSGCCELGEYGSGSQYYDRDPKHGCLIGAGCEECGYTGKRIESCWVPIGLDID